MKCSIGPNYLRKNIKRAVVRTALVLLATSAVGAALAGCGGGGEQGLIVLAASSLQDPLTAYGDSFRGAEVRSAFAGSDTLAAQIRQGAAAGVFASADTEYPRELHREGLLEEPVVFAANELVIAVPDASRVSSLADLAGPDVKIVVGTPNVPVGAYTRQVLGALPPAERGKILANVRSEEPAASSIVAKLAGGAADAGFVYVTDVAAATGLRAVRVSERLRPEIAYAAAVVKGSGSPRLAQRWLDGLLRGRGAAELRAAGFLSPP